VSIRVLDAKLDSFRDILIQTGQLQAILKQHSMQRATIMTAYCMKTVTEPRQKSNKKIYKVDVNQSAITENMMHTCAHC